MITFGCLQVKLVELLEIIDGARPYSDTFLGCFPNVAAPQLIHAGEQIAGCLISNRQLEHETRLAGREAIIVARWSPTEAAHGIAQSGRLVVDHIRHSFAEPINLRISDGRLHRFRTPLTGDHRSADPYAERICPLDVLGQRVQPSGDVFGFPVNNGALGQVGEVLLDLGQLTVKDQPGAADAVVLVEPSDRLALPLALDFCPSGSLEEAHPWPALVEGHMLHSGDRLYGERHGENLIATDDNERQSRVLAYRTSSVGGKPGIGVRTRGGPPARGTRQVKCINLSRAIKVPKGHGSGHPTFRGPEAEGRA